MSDVKIYDVKPEIAANAHITADTYKALYQRSIAEPEAFWAEQAAAISGLEQALG